MAEEETQGLPALPDQEEIPWEELEAEIEARKRRFPPFLGWGKTLQSGKYVGFFLPPVRYYTNKFGRKVLAAIFVLKNPTTGKWEVYTIAPSSKRLLSQLLKYYKMAHQNGAFFKLQIEWSGVGFYRQYTVTQLEFTEEEAKEVFNTIQQQFPELAEQIKEIAKKVQQAKQQQQKDLGLSEEELRYALAILGQLRAVISFSGPFPEDRINNTLWNNLGIPVKTAWRVYEKLKEAGYIKTEKRKKKLYIVEVKEL